LSTPSKVPNQHAHAPVMSKPGAPVPPSQTGAAAELRTVAGGAIRTRWSQHTQGHTPQPAAFKQTGPTGAWRQSSECGSRRVAGWCATAPGPSLRIQLLLLHSYTHTHMVNVQRLEHHTQAPHNTQAQAQPAPQQQ
jgi:hypothetical protein